MCAMSNDWKPVKKVPKNRTKKPDDKDVEWSQYDKFVFDQLVGNALGFTAKELADELSQHLGVKVTKSALGDTLYEGKISKLISRNPKTRRWTLNK